MQDIGRSGKPIADASGTGGRGVLLRHTSCRERARRMCRVTHAEEFFSCARCVDAEQRRRKAQRDRAPIITMITPIRTTILTTILTITTTIVITNTGIIMITRAARSA